MSTPPPFGPLRDIAPALDLRLDEPLRPDGFDREGVFVAALHQLAASGIRVC